MFYSTTFAPAFERESDTDGSPRRRSGKKLATATVREEKKEKKLPEKFGSSGKLLTFAVTFREGATREEIFERIFIPTKVVQVSRPDGCPDRMSRQLITGTKRQ